MCIYGSFPQTSVYIALGWMSFLGSFHRHGFKVNPISQKSKPSGGCSGLSCFSGVRSANPVQKHAQTCRSYPRKIQRPLSSEGSLGYETEKGYWTCYISGAEIFSFYPIFILPL